MAAATTKSGNVTFEQVKNFLYVPGGEDKKVKKYFAVLVGRPIGTRRPPFIVDNWAECQSSVHKFKHSKEQAQLTQTNGVYFKSFKTLDEAVNWTVGGFIVAARDQLLRHISLQ